MHGTVEPTRTEKTAISILENQPILENVYFHSLGSGDLTKDRFIDSQIQFSFAVGFFSRALAALTARLPTSGDRSVLVHNLSEEHGLDEEHPEKGFRAHLSHDRTFSKFLSTLGVPNDVFSTSSPEPPVRAFNLSLIGACQGETPGFAFAALGMIEYSFSDISALIGRSTIELEWVKPKDLVHYSLHEEIDKRHAAELFEAAERTGDPISQIEQGLSYGHFIFDQLYRNLVPLKIS